MIEDFSAWLAAIRSMTVTPEAAALYLNHRLRFTTAVAQELCLLLAQSQQRLVYGIWLDGHSKPIYIGQTSNGRRRLWDLPIGESHHVSNSFPPEVWGRVVVVYWHQVLASDAALARELQASLLSSSKSESDSHLDAIGLGIEYLLQKRHQPLFNSRKKRRDGTWHNIDWLESKSQAAKISATLPELFERVDRIWQSLSEHSAAPDTSSFAVEGGRVVFPAAVRGKIAA